jgi:hypothetical protein
VQWRAIGMIEHMERKRQIEHEAFLIKTAIVSADPTTAPNLFSDWFGDDVEDDPDNPSNAIYEYTDQAPMTPARAREILAAMGR